MEANDNNNAKKFIILVYLDFNRTTYRYFLIDNADTTAGELVERILSKLIDPQSVKEKAKNFSLYLINSKIIEAQGKYNKQKHLITMDTRSDFESMVDHANLFPNILKRKLNQNDKPIHVLQRTRRRIGMKNPDDFEWDFYFLGNSSRTVIRRGTIGSSITKEGAIFDQLVNNITDKRYFHRKGT